MYSFVDASGCVFLNTYSGETLSVGLAEPELIDFISSGKIYDNVITSLIDKGFIKPIDLKNYNAE